MDFAQLEAGKGLIASYVIAYPAEFYVHPRCHRKWPIYPNNVFTERRHFTTVVLTSSARLKYVTGKPHVQTQELRRSGSYYSLAYIPEQGSGVGVGPGVGSGGVGLTFPESEPESEAVLLISRSRSRK